ncbi:MAG TPA: rRNA maturation RNase YbeY [Gemmatimonadaceae bacterium]|nr:rRNA maturation RNase YbeY [Gemmatimonadaceae bacterium]
MSLDVDVTTNGIRTSVGRVGLADAARAALRAERIGNALLSVTLLDRAGIARMNRRHLDHAGATDVISFGFARATPRDPVIGDIYICPDIARANAKERGVSPREELVRLVVHGTLHVLGYDHPESDDRERSEMWRRQERVVRRLAARGRVAR